MQIPFWEMTYKNEKVFYACLNQKKSSAPEHIKDKGIYIAGDLAETLRDLKENIALLALAVACLITKSRSLPLLPFLVPIFAIIECMGSTV